MVNQTGWKEPCCWQSISSWQSPSSSCQQCNKYVMEERINCINCGASILTQTAKRTGGVCKPCFNRDLQSAIAETAFGQAYATSFDQPKFHSEIGWSWFDIWNYMELELAGLLFSLRCSGN